MAGLLWALTFLGLCRGIPLSGWHLAFLGVSLVWRMEALKIKT